MLKIKKSKYLKAIWLRMSLILIFDKYISLGKQWLSVCIGHFWMNTSKMTVLVSTSHKCDLWWTVDPAQTRRIYIMKSGKEIVSVSVGGVTSGCVEDSVLRRKRKNKFERNQ